MGKPLYQDQTLVLIQTCQIHDEVLREHGFYMIKVLEKRMNMSEQ
ncbi:hypothetical protein P4534_17855 [Peribacillus butanolivorans]|nr:hypothetical protein [Peribacillus butanolivorans]